MCESIHAVTLTPRSPTGRQSFGYEGTMTGEDNRVPSPYQALSNGYGPPKSDQQMGSRGLPGQPVSPAEMAMDVAADSHLPQTLLRDPLMADESGYDEEDNRAQTLRDMELYRVVQRFHTTMNFYRSKSNSAIGINVEVWVKEWALGCVSSAS